MCYVHEWWCILFSWYFIQNIVFGIYVITTIQFMIQLTIQFIGFLQEYDDDDIQR